jgi:phosphate transport system permease protein
MMINRKSNAVSTIAGYTYSWIAITMVVCVCLLIIINIIIEGFPVLSWEFLTTEPPASARNIEGGGIFTPLVGTILLTLLGMLIAFPFSLATAIYLCFYSKKGVFRNVVKTAIDILSGVPTIVIALFALSIFTLPWLAFLSTPVELAGGAVERAYGRSFITASIAMAIMILPFVIKSMEEALKSVPLSYIEGAYALGANKWRMISKVVLKSATDGLVTGVILGMGRIIGDTAIVWLVLGGTLRMSGMQPWFLPENWLPALQGTGSTLTSYIYYTSPIGEGNNYTVAFGASFVLIIIIIVLNAITAIIGNMSKVKVSR